MNRLPMLVLLLVVSSPLLVNPARAEVCGITINQEQSALAGLVRSTRERLEQNQATLPELTGIPSEIQMALVRGRAPNWQLPGSFYGRVEQAPAMDAATDAAVAFRVALREMANASHPDQIAMARNAALAAIEANHKAYEGFLMSTGITPSARAEVGNLVRSNVDRNARLSTMVTTYAQVLTSIRGGQG